MEENPQGCREAGDTKMIDMFRVDWISTGVYIHTKILVRTWDEVDHQTIM